MHIVVNMLQYTKKILNKQYVIIRIYNNSMKKALPINKNYGCFCVLKRSNEV